MSLSSAFERVLDHKPEPFMAPVPEARTVRLFSLQDNVPYWFSIRDPEPGWWWVRPTPESNARLDEILTVGEVLGYLDAFPNSRRFYVLTCFPVSSEAWMVIPFNPSDANQRGWLHSQPRVMHLIQHSLDRGEVCTACDMAGTLIYQDCFGMPVEAVPSQITLAQHLLDAHVAELNRQRLLEEAKQRHANVEDNIRWHLEFSGADLVDWSELPDGYEVTYVYNDHEWTMPVTRDLRIVTPGVCLQNTQRQHNLSTIVDVMEQAIELQRYDLPERFVR